MIKLKNKRGASLAGWTEGIILSLLIVGAFALVITDMNGLYSQDYQIGLGTNTTSNEYVTYQDTLQEQVLGGEAEFDASQGLTLKSSWGMLKSSVTIAWNFITGGWIETIIIEYMGLPAILATSLRMLYFLSLGYIILKILFKVKP